MTLGIGAVVVVDEARLWFPRDATAALRACLDAVADGRRRAGMHWGMAVERDGHVVGRAVDVAEQLAHLARPGEVVCSCAALRRAEREYRVDEIGRVDCPGAAAPLPVVYLAPASV